MTSPNTDTTSPSPESPPNDTVPSNPMPEPEPEPTPTEPSPTGPTIEVQT